MKIIELQDGSVIIDGFKKLIVLSSEFVAHQKKEKEEKKSYKWESFHLQDDLRDCACNAVPFKTQKGRDAIRIVSGNTWKINVYSGSGDRDWHDWHDRKYVENDFCLISDAHATSNGGGCWSELQIYKDGCTTAEQAKYFEELA